MRSRAHAVLFSRSLSGTFWRGKARASARSPTLTWAVRAVLWRANMTSTVSLLGRLAHHRLRLSELWMGECGWVSVCVCVCGMLVVGCVWFGELGRGRVGGGVRVCDCGWVSVGGELWVRECVCGCWSGGVRVLVRECGGDMLVGARYGISTTYSTNHMSRNVHIY